MPRVRVEARRKAVARAPVVEGDCAEAERASRPRAEIESARNVCRMCVEKFSWPGKKGNGCYRQHILGSQLSALCDRVRRKEGRFHLVAASYLAACFDRLREPPGRTSVSGDHGSPREPLVRDIGEDPAFAFAVMKAFLHDVGADSESEHVDRDLVHWTVECKPPKLQPWVVHANA